MRHFGNAEKLMASGLGTKWKASEVPATVELCRHENSLMRGAGYSHSCGAREIGMPLSTKHLVYITGPVTAKTCSAAQKWMLPMCHQGLDVVALLVVRLL